MVEYTKRGMRSRTKGTFELTFTATDRDAGTSRRKVKTVKAKNASQAKKIFDKMVVDLNEGRIVFDSGLEVSRLVREHVDVLKRKGEIEPSTVRSYLNDAKLIDSGIGSVKLARLTVKDVDEWMASLREQGYAPGTIRRAFNRLKAAIKYAQANEKIAKNVCDFTRPPKQVKGEYTVLDDEERARMLSICLKAIPEPLAIAVFLALSTGMRREEVCGLRAGDYNEKTGVISVRRVVALADGGAYIKPPKTEASARDIPVAGITREVLGSLKRFATKAVGMYRSHYDPYLAGVWEPGGRFYHPTQLSKDFATFRRMHGFPDGLRFHDLRHGWVTLALKNGSDVATVASYAGHSNPSQTLGVYANPDLTSRRAAASLIDDALGWHPQLVDGGEEHLG